METLRNLSLGELSRLWSYTQGMAYTFREGNPAMVDFWRELSREVAESFHAKHLHNTGRLQHSRMQEWHHFTR